ncbi:MAG TPA: hypothetical protein VN922_24865 [Bacteroidia bacterium]|nr:hypothetical protein [Bacteroidia bacterium]
MKLKTTRVLFCLLTAGILTTNVDAQSSSSSAGANNSKLFTEWGFSPLLGFAEGPLTNINSYEYNYSTGSYVETTSIARYTTFVDFTLLFRVRYNITEMNNNMSLSVSVFPGLGLSASTSTFNGDNSSASGGTGALFLNIPVFIDLNIGNVATYSSDQDKGFVVGLGIEYTKAPLLATNPTGYIDARGDTGPLVITSGWIEPVIELGYRYWNKKNKAKEFNLKFGYGGGFTAQLSWMKCIGY